MSGDQSVTSDAGESDAQLLRQFLLTRDAKCPRCAYNLRMLSGDICPECGLRLVLGVHAVEPILRAWICTLLATSLVAGIGLLFLMLIFGHAGLPPRQFWWLIGTSIAAIPFSLLLIWRRRRFLRLQESAQWAVAGACVVVLVIVLFGLLLIR